MKDTIAITREEAAAIVHLIGFAEYQSQADEFDKALGKRLEAELQKAE